MKQIGLLLLLFFFLFSCGNSSKLFPKRYLGEYHGVQEAYEVATNDTRVEVPKSTYDLSFSYGDLLMSSPSQTIKGSYTVAAETKMYYSLNVVLENGITEHWKLWKKGKKLIREAVQPETNIIFLKN